MLFNFYKTVQGRYYYAPCFDEETKLQENKHPSQGPTAGE